VDDRFRVTVSFPLVGPGVFSDYKRGDMVELKATVPDKPESSSDNIKLVGKSVAVQGKPKSLVTDQGRAAPP
jgi:hypothetical protein